MKLLLQELETMSLALRLVIKNPDTNPAVTNYLKQIVGGNKSTIEYPEIDIEVDMDEDISQQIESQIEKISETIKKSELDEMMDTDEFQKRKDVYKPGEESECRANIEWESLDLIKDPKKYIERLKEISTNPKYPVFNQIYFHAGDIIQFERYGFIQSRLLDYPDVIDTYKNKIFIGNNYETTYATFRYMFDKLKKGIYVVIKDGELSVYLPFSNIGYINDWSEILKRNNPQLVKRMIKEKMWTDDPKKKHLKKEMRNIQDPSRWYANNCIFRPEQMRFTFSEFIQEGDKTSVPFKHFIYDFLETMKTEGKTINDVEFFINPRDFPVLKENYGEPYEQIFPGKQIEEEYRSPIYTPILSQSGNTDYHDIPLPTEDDLMRITNNIYPDSCKNNYNKDFDFEADFSKKKATCVFRGSATGCGITRDTNMRLNAALLSYEWGQTEDKKDLLDAKLVGWNRKPKMYDGQLGEINTRNFPKDFVVNRKKNFMDLEEQSTFKYILNIDGHVKAFRLGNEMRMHSVILLVNSPYTLWFQDKMIEYEHFVPIKDNLSDLESQIKWCRDNEDKCEVIANKAFEFYDRYLTKKGTYEYFENLISQLSKIRKPPSVKMNNNKLNIIVAYRDPGDGSRKTQLDIFIKQMMIILKGRTNYYIHIIEQESDRDDYDKLPKLLKQPISKMAKFNLGRLKNIGFHISKEENKDEDNAYYVLSDVDLLPSYELLPKYLEYPKTVIHLGNEGTRYNENNSDPKFLGGVISVNENDFMKVNGYPNNFWGWGGEDNALSWRLNKNKIKIEKPTEPVIDLEEYTLTEKLDILRKNKAKEIRKREKIDADKAIWKVNGLNNIEDTYEIISETNYQDLDNVGHTIVKLKIMKNDNIE